MQRGGKLELDTKVTRFGPRAGGFTVETPSGAFDAEHLVLNLTHWDAQRLASPELTAAFAGTVKRHPEAWGACTLHLGV